MHVQPVTGPLVLRGDWGMTGLTSHFGYPGVRKYSTRVAGDRQDKDFIRKHWLRPSTRQLGSQARPFINWTSPFLLVLGFLISRRMLVKNR